MAAETRKGPALVSPVPLNLFTTTTTEAKIARYRALPEIAVNAVVSRSTLNAAKKLNAATRLIGEARAQRLVEGDEPTARRLNLLADHVRQEAEMLDGVALHDLVVPTPSYPPGATIGWLARHDAATRAARRAAGLSVPEVDRG